MYFYINLKNFNIKLDLCQIIISSFKNTTEFKI